MYLITLAPMITTYQRHLREKMMHTKTYVWDPLVRFSHWTLVLAFTIAYLSGDEENALHVYSGYYILGLIAVRIIWGLIGTHYARFSHFAFSPAAVVDYLKGFIGAGSGKQYTGHNPAGSWMVIIMLLSLLATGLSGLLVYGLEGYGPLAQSSSEFWEDAWEEIHELFANFTVLLVLVHIGGVIASSLKQGQNLVKSMVNGYKQDK